MIIDWTQPICLDTVPPRPARVDCVGGNGRARIEADFHGDGLPSFIWTSPETGLSHDVPWGLPRVRNVRQGDFEPAEPAPDLAAELAEARKLVVDLADGLNALDGRWWELAECLGIEESEAKAMSAKIEEARAALAKWDAAQ